MKRSKMSALNLNEPIGLDWIRNDAANNPNWIPFLDPLEKNETFTYINAVIKSIFNKEYISIVWFKSAISKYFDKIKVKINPLANDNEDHKQDIKKRNQKNQDFTRMIIIEIVFYFYYIIFYN